MIFIFSALISLVVSLATYIVFFRLTAKEKVKEKVTPVPVIAESIPEVEEEKEESAFNNFFTDDPAFLENMKSILDDYSSSSPIILRGPTGVGKTHLMRAF